MFKLFNFSHKLYKHIASNTADGIFKFSVSVSESKLLDISSKVELDNSMVCPTSSLSSSSISWSISVPCFSNVSTFLDSSGELSLLEFNSLEVLGVYMSKSLIEVL